MRLRLLSVGVLAVWLLPAAAFAHPFVPDAVPVDSAATLTLDMAHGCVAAEQDHASQAGEPTREVGVRFPDAISVRMVVDDGGFTVVDAKRDGAFDDWTLLAPDGVDIAAPVFTFAVVVDASASDTLWLQVYQRCDTGKHQWVATPDAPDGEPGVRVRLAAADPAAPAVGAPERQEPVGPPVDDNDTVGDDAVEDDDADAPAIDFIGIDIPQTSEAWLWYVVIAGVIGVLLAKRSRNQKR